MEAYIIDEKGKLCKEGVVGELCLAGIGLAWGYLNNEELNKKSLRKESKVVQTKKQL